MAAADEVRQALVEAKKKATSEQRQFDIADALDAVKPFLQRPYRKDA